VLGRTTATTSFTRKPAVVDSGQALPVSARNAASSRQRLVLPFVICILALAGCSGDDSTSRSSGTAATGLSPAQAQALEDRKITYQEYHDSFARFASCASDAGVNIQEMPTDGDVIEYATPEDAAAIPEFDVCYNEEFKQVDIQWQLDHSETSESAKVLRECLEKFRLPPESSNLDRAAALKAAGHDLAECG